NTIKTTTSSSTTTESATISAIDVSAAPAVATTYHFTSSTPGQVTLTRASDGATQTLTLAAIAAGGSATLHFSTLGAVFTINSAGGIKATTRPTSQPNALNTTSKTRTTNDTATITAIDVSRAPAVTTTYTITSSTPGQVTLTRASNGATQTLTLASIAAG